jgi:hypothetical protein
VDAAGVVTVIGRTNSTDYPTTPGALDTTLNGSDDVFVTRLDPSLPAAQQLVYSTFLGGTSIDEGSGLRVDAYGVVTVAGTTQSANHPTTGGAFDTTFNGGWVDAFVTRLDPSLPASQQLVYSTFVGGVGGEQARALSMEASGVVTITGWTSSTDYPTTPGAFDTTHNGTDDVFVTRLDPSRPAAQQLVYSTFVGGPNGDLGFDLWVGATGVVTITGVAGIASYPTTPGAFDTTFNGGYSDVFVTRLDPSLPGAQQLVYSTFLGGSGWDWGIKLACEPSGVITVAGYTESTGYPTTPGAFDRFLVGNGSDAFVTRLDPARPGAQQLLYSTFVGGSEGDWAWALALEASGGVTIAGGTRSLDYATTPGAYDTIWNGFEDVFVTRLDMLPTGVSAFGRSSPGCAGPLPISVTSMPSVGNAGFAITCGNAPPGGIGLLLAGGAGLASPINVLGVEIWIDPNPFLVTFGVTSNGVGASEFALPIPGSVGLVGTRLCTQFAWISPSSPPPCPPLGVSASDAVDIIIQP